jgi:Tfp pilus assembly PilM family ATPase
MRCLQYYESVFRAGDVDRIVFTGGQAQDRRVCQELAKMVNLPAEIGDPLAAVGCTEAEPSNPEHQPQPGYAVSVGLSIGDLDN